eukprot:GHUV01035597.1.p1 GENE.GHUV01035597.1~~GHUV01035597.1.p1  ORF type:complete len:243 (+),score=76.56 GHUV01035597.1:82-729(+)
MNEGTPGDSWFDTAPDGPGSKADKCAGIVLREPLKAIQQAEAAPPQPVEAEEKTKTGNIVTSWGQGATKRVPRGSSQDAAGTSTAGALAAAAVGARPSVPAVRPIVEAAAQQPPAASAPTADSAQPAGRAASGQIQKARKSMGVGARRICTSTGGARTEPPVTRSMSRLGLNLCSPVPEGRVRDNFRYAKHAHAGSQQQLAEILSHECSGGCFEK